MPANGVSAISGECVFPEKWPGRHVQPSNGHQESVDEDGAVEPGNQIPPVQACAAIQDHQLSGTAD